eukprot:4191272-Pyramimonas_sp.AAC.1
MLRQHANGNRVRERCRVIRANGGRRTSRLSWLLLRNDCIGLAALARLSLMIAPLSPARLRHVSG